MQNPEISIISPIFNSQSFLAECIESILAQTFTNFELILVDDGSTDSSFEICNNYKAKDSRIHIIKQENKGVSEARNTGISAARAPWITFIDSDDWIEPNYLEYLIDNLKKDRNIDWVTSGLNYVYPNGTKLYEVPTPHGLYYTNDEKDFFTIATQNLVTSPVGKLYKTKLINDFNIRFNNNLSYGEDRDFNLRYINVLSSCIISCGLLYSYRKGSQSSLSTIKKGNLLKGDIEYWNDLYESFKKRNLVNNQNEVYLVKRLFYFITDNLSQRLLSYSEIQEIKHIINWDFLKLYISMVPAKWILKVLIYNKCLFLLNRLLYRK